MTYRQIARLSGVSIEAVHRSASGVGRIRASTQEAILTVATSANGRG
jgi:DNA-binding LacI/PurR family transcriptional regulator